ncbi:MAG: hypothetical protein HXO13_03725 [Prevotella salivae]|nr:hypothetical protein [Segatella salivae]
MRKHGYNEGINSVLRLESVTPMALCHAQYMLTQGNPHYRLATLGYRKRNTYGVETFYL